MDMHAEKIFSTRSAILLPSGITSVVKFVSGKSAPVFLADGLKTARKAHQCLLDEHKLPLRPLNAYLTRSKSLSQCYITYF